MPYIFFGLNVSIVVKHCSCILFFTNVCNSCIRMVHLGCLLLLVRGVMNALVGACARR